MLEFIGVFWSPVYPIIVHVVVLTNHILCPWGNAIQYLATLTSNNYLQLGPMRYQGGFVLLGWDIQLPFSVFQLFIRVRKWIPTTEFSSKKNSFCSWGPFFAVDATIRTSVDAK